MAEWTGDLVRLTGMHFLAKHGVYDFERAKAQDFVVDVTCQLAARDDVDDLDTTVDYATLSSAIEADVKRDSVNLIETLAERIAATCLSHPLITRVEVTVHKPRARMPVTVADVSVTITRSKP
jgi:dihydroneopterin aldolase